MSAAFFIKHPSNESCFTPTDHTRGPWSEHHCHAGPPTGLLARALEQVLPEQRLTRITVELTRPIPFAELFVTAKVLSQGRTVSTAEAQLQLPNGKPVLNARALFMKPANTPLNYPDDVLKHQPKRDYGSPDDAHDGPFPIQQTLHDLPAFNGDGVQTRYLSGENEGLGKTAAWLKTVPLVLGETPSPFQRICPLADCGNAFGRLAEPEDVTFMNTDLTVILHRDPIGDWLGSDSECYWEPNGIGLSDSRLFDHKGVVGRAVQTLLLR